MKSDTRRRILLPNLYVFLLRTMLALGIARAFLFLVRTNWSFVLPDENVSSHGRQRDHCGR